MRCLFLTHKCGDAAPNTGESVIIPHLLHTFDEWGQGERQVLWTDELHYAGRDLASEVLSAAASNPDAAGDANPKPRIHPPKPIAGGHASAAMPSHYSAI